MAQQHINLGTPPNGADGDTNRTAWGKAEANFNELFSRPIAVGKNRLINGNFDVWQRGTSLAANGGGSYRYLADRFATNANGTTVAPSQQAFAPGQTAVPNEPAFFHRSVVASNAGANFYCIMVQRIEDVRTLAGRTATLSFWAKADAAKPMSVDFEQNFGAGGSPSPLVNGIGSTKINLSTVWQFFQIPVTFPSIAGKTIGTTAASSFINVVLWFDAGSNFNSRTNALGQQSGTFDIAQIQLEAGAVATEFDQRLRGAELALCQRYYQKSYAYSVSLGTATPAGAIAGRWHGSGAMTGAYFPVAMRTPPAVVIYSTNGSAGSATQFNGGSDVVSSLVADQIGDGGFFRVNGVGGSAGEMYRYHYSADAEF